MWGWSRARESRDREQGGQRLRMCERAHWCARAASARASWGERRKKEVGGQGRGVLWRVVLVRLSPTVVAKT